MFITVAGCLALLAAAAPAATVWQQVGKFTAEDGAAADVLGNSVGVDGVTAIAGALHDDDNGDDSGSAYVFDVLTGEQLAKLTAADGTAGDEFGYAVAISGNIAVVGARYDNVADTESGSAYVFDVTTGEQLHKLVPDDGAEYDRFGWAVAVSGNLALVAAPFDDDYGSNSGAVYVYDVTTGAMLRRLTAQDAGNYWGFGYSVALEGETALIGASGATGQVPLSGAAYVFNVATGQQLRKLYAGDGSDADDFGGAVAMCGDLGIIGASWDDVAEEYSGSAYLFNLATGQQLHKIAPPDPIEEGFFGRSVAINDSVAIIGAKSDTPGVWKGIAYVFDLATGQKLQKLVSQGIEDGDNFAVSMAVDGELAVVGQSGDDDVASCAGAACVFAPNDCPADYDEDGDVDTADLLHLLGCWGTPDGDVDGDADTDTADLLALLGTWGECP